jgi:multidrug efflux pump subunit AcrA (membrane-fusion protein)
MRVEIDLPNPKGILRDGMYGKATILIDSASKNLTVPPAAVFEHRGRAQGIIFIARDGLARRTEVTLGSDDGKLVEILKGLKPEDAIIVHASSPLEDGIPVVEASPSAPST